MARRRDEHTVTSHSVTGALGRAESEAREKREGGREGQGKDPHELLWALAPSEAWVLTQSLEKRKSFPIPALGACNLNVRPF